ncbi:hypothetical protein [Priestia endophytica]|uniref:hypothetical protein n=1 Tax=Priestia endophytica TaxID=135735 RepID=UPI00227FF409|nr:hypothetical protein [Priestia endophytica]MCY8234774.1 hypothetical protein [Priestia endophytica]
MKELAMIIFSALIFLTGSAESGELEKLEEKLMARVNQDQHISQEGKEIIKESGILKYEVKTYRDEMEVEKISIEDVEHEDQQPFITLDIKEKGKKDVYHITCGINNREDKKCERINDSYLLNVVSSGARKEIEPYVKKAFGDMNPEYLIVAEPGKKVKAEMLKSREWDYDNYQKRVPVTITFRVDGSPNEAMYEKMVHFLKAFKQEENIKLDTINFYYIKGPISQYKGDETIKALQADQDSIDNLNSIDELKELEVEEDGIWSYLSVKEEMVQQDQ